MIHPKADVHETARIAESTTVWQFASVGAGTKIGPGGVIGSCAYIGKNCRIGEGVRIQHGAFLPNGTVVEDHAFIGPNVTCTDDRYPRAGNHGYEARPPHILKSASIGAGAVLLPGVCIGAFAMVGAGAVVTHDVMYGELVKGVPARTTPKEATDGSSDHISH